MKRALRNPFPRLFLSVGLLMVCAPDPVPCASSTVSEEGWARSEERVLVSAFCTDGKGTNDVIQVASASGMRFSTVIQGRELSSMGRPLSRRRASDYFLQAFGRIFLRRVQDGSLLVWAAFACLPCWWLLDWVFRRRRSGSESFVQPGQSPFRTAAISTMR